jgi:DNA-3-methyladenine glycosylase
MCKRRLTRDFYIRDVLEVAPDLIGKNLVCNHNGHISANTIMEVEAYRGIEDQACHARFGFTRRNSVMYKAGGPLYVYLVYGIHWMLNVVTGPLNKPQAVLIRGIQGYLGPGILTKALGIEKSFYGEDLVRSKRIWIEPHLENPVILQKPRIGIDYAGEPWKSIAWRYILDNIDS